MIDQAKKPRSSRASPESSGKSRTESMSTPPMIDRSDDKIPADERDVIGDEFVVIAERVRRKYGLPIPVICREMHGILNVSVYPM